MELVNKFQHQGKKDSVVTITNEDMGIYITNNPSYGFNY